MRKKNQSIAILLTATDYGKRHKLTRAGVHDRIKTGKVNAVNVGGIFLIEDKMRINP